MRQATKINVSTPSSLILHCVSLVNSESSFLMPKEDCELCWCNLLVNIAIGEYGSNHMRLLSDTFAFLKKVTIHCHYMDEFKQDIFFH